MAIIFNKLKTLLFSSFLLFILFSPDIIAAEPWAGQTYPWQQITLVIALALLLFVWEVRLAQKEHFLTLTKDLFTLKSLGLILLAYALMRLFDHLGFYWLQQIGQDTTSNEALINEALGKQPPLLSFLTAALLGPFTEELIVRGYWMKKLFGSYKWLGLFITSFVFAALHGPTDWPSWFIYASAGFILGGLYMKTDNLAYSIALHILNNTIAFLG